ncbi:MAG: protein phosphatase 2C domain-containing protein, partial [Ruminococcus sp.]|nr:protein phosphatase 2C domain-containing protein [Ruminococcus sp.]
AAERNMALDSMDCTLLFACLFLKQNMAIIGCLGDSALCVIRDDKAPALFCDSGFIGTRAVLDHDAAEHLQCAVFPLDGHVKSILLTSDGLENEIYCKGLTHVAKNTELYLNAMLRDKPEKIMQKRVEELTAAEDTVFDDDISVAVLSCLDRPVRLEDDPTWPCVCGAENLLVDTFCSECSRDFLDLYKNIDFKGDRAGFFRYIRRNPKAKQALMSAIADGSVPFTPAMRPQPAQTQPTDDHTVAYAAPEQTAPLQPTGSLAPEQTMPPRRVETKSAKKTNTVMLAVVVAAVVVCAALMTMLLMALLRNGQEEAQKPEPAVTATAKPPTPTKRHEKSRRKTARTAKPEHPLSCRRKAKKAQGANSRRIAACPTTRARAKVSIRRKIHCPRAWRKSFWVQRAAVTTIIPIILTIPMISIMTGTLTDNRKTADKQNRQTLYFAWMCRYSVFYNIHN